MCLGKYIFHRKCVPAPTEPAPDDVVAKCTRDGHKMFICIWHMLALSLSQVTTTHDKQQVGDCGEPHLSIDNVFSLWDSARWSSSDAFSGSKSKSVIVYLIIIRCRKQHKYCQDEFVRLVLNLQPICSHIRCLHAKSMCRSNVGKVWCISKWS